ncbi:MAG: aspartyl/asparaginyl beta-hydroxylase domain-containing protein [Gammaproteobacteria bacterium]|nr:aspartyl/asparaginyl beta-hydroxylase domain-containing protein [Gammaproteobacteria bacterium]
MNKTADEASWLLRSGRIEEAEQAYMRVLAEDPFNLQALNIVALAAIRLGQLHRAAELLDRAVSVAPGHAASHHHRGRAAELLGDLATARGLHERAVQLGADLPAARLHLAAVLEQQGEHQAALVQYARVMGDMQSRGRWLDAATTPPALVSLVAHAAQVVREGRRVLFYGVIEPLVREFGRSGLARIERMLRIYLKDEAADYPDSRQRPTFLYFPGLPTTPWLEPGLFPGLDEAAARTAAIRAELESQLRADRGSEQVFSSTALAAENLRSTREAPSWTGYYFYRHGVRREDNCAACPVTSATLDALPLSRVGDHGPEVLFSVFTPGTHLLPHRGVTNTRVVAHLPLIVPPDCALAVGGEVHEWQEGRIVVFDDTYEHEAWNRSVRVRVVLIFDLWNPHLSELERAAVERLVVAIGDFRQAREQA